MSLVTLFTSIYFLTNLHIFCAWMSDGLFINHNENVELIQQRPGYDIRLKCSLDGLVDQDKIKAIKVRWYFKPCRGDLLSSNNCHNFRDDNWTQLLCEESFCQPDLVLRNVTENYSGLYKCTVYPLYQIKLVRTYQLDVKNTTVALPTFLEQPINRTATIGERVVLQCLVHSEVHPTIMWFRRKPERIGFDSVTSKTSNTVNDDHIIQYNGHTYALMPTAREKSISNEIYLNKLIINGVRPSDESFYACVAISYRGHRIKETYLKVVSSNYMHSNDRLLLDYDQPDEKITDPKQFLLLFLMPLGLAMLPITVWACYITYKKCYNTESRINQQYLDEENITDHCILRT